MRISRMLFVSSATFSAVLGIAYWSIAREWVGTLMLGFMTAALCVIAAYMFFAERDARLFGDNKQATMAEAAGENVGTYVTHSPIPFWIGIATATIVIGLVVSPAIGGFAAIVLLFLAALLVVRSR